MKDEIFIFVGLFKVPCLLKALPELFTTDILLRFYDIQTAVGRKATARDLCMLRNINLKPSK